MKFISLPKLLICCLLLADELEIGIVVIELDSGLLVVRADDFTDRLVASAASDEDATRFLLIIENDRKVDADEMALMVEFKDESPSSESSPRSIISITDGDMVCASLPSSRQDFALLRLL